MATQLVPAKDRVKTVRDMLEKSKAQIALALPKHMTSDRMLRVAMTEIQKTPLLLECHPTTLVAAVVQAAQLGLELGVLGQAYLVPFRNSKKNRMEVQLIPGYRGLVQLARRSGQIETFEARVVHERDTFEVGYGLDAKLTHKPYMPTKKDDPDDPGKVVAAYAFARFKDGGYQYEVMSVRELNAIKASSKASSSGPWVTHTEEMYRKTVARRLCKWLPASVELATAVELDSAAEAGLPQDLGDVIDVEATADDGAQAEPEPAGKLDAASAKLEGKPQEREPGADDDDDPARCKHVKLKFPIPAGKTHVCLDCGEELRG